MRMFLIIKDLPWARKGEVFWLREGTLIRMKEDGSSEICLAEPYRTTVNYFFNEDYTLNANEYIKEVLIK